MPRLVMETGRHVTVDCAGKTRTLDVRHIWYGSIKENSEPQWYVAVWDVHNEEFYDFPIQDMKPVQ